MDKIPVKITDFSTMSIDFSRNYLCVHRSAEGLGNDTNWSGAVWTHWFSCNRNENLISSNSHRVRRFSRFNSSASQTAHTVYGIVSESLPVDVLLGLRMKRHVPLALRLKLHIPLSETSNIISSLETYFLSYTISYQPITVAARSKS
jgi:hypothetical protein